MKPFHQFMGCDGLIVGLDIAAYFFKDSPVYIFLSFSGKGKIIMHA